MTKEQVYFIKVLADHLAGCETERGSQYDWVELNKIGKQQQLSGIFFWQCKGIMDNAAVFEELQQAYASQLFYSTNRNRLVNSLINSFNEVGIPHCVVKGYEVMKYYPVPALRSMGDTDIMIRSCDRNIAHNLMLENDFTWAKGNKDEWTYYRNGMCIEIHDSMVHPHKGNERLLDYFNNLWEYGTFEKSQLILDWNFHFMYLIQHLSGHFLITGVGLRQFMDIAVVAKSVDLDWDMIKSEMEKLKLWTFCLRVLSFCKKAFKVNFAFPIEEMRNDLYEETLMKIFNDGVFGHEDIENSEYSKAIMTKVYQGREGDVVLFSEIQSRVFPSYEVMRTLPYCRFVDGRKFLLPIAWLWRIVYRLATHSYGKVDKADYVVNWNDDELIRRINLIAKWGL